MIESLSNGVAVCLDEAGGAWSTLDVKCTCCAVLQMDGLQASTLIQQMYAPDDRPRIIAVSADTLQVCCHHPGMLVIDAEGVGCCS